MKKLRRPPITFSIEIGRRVRETIEKNIQAHQDTYFEFTPEETSHQNIVSREPDSENRADYIDSQLFAPSDKNSPLAIPQAGNAMSSLCMTDDLMSQQDPSWNRAPMKNESHLPHQSFIAQSCSCNGITGPCPDHLQKMQTQIIAETTSTRSLSQQPPNHRVPISHMSIPRHPHQTSLSWPGSPLARYVLFLFTPSPDFEIRGKW